MYSQAESIELIAQWLATSHYGVAFTGAGISTESGIPDFRSPGGIWASSQPVYFDDFVGSASARYEYWRQKAIAHQDFARSQPNVGHRTLAQWEQNRQLQAVITQNIDGLHQLAGSRSVVELHGTARWIECLECGDREPAEQLVSQFLAEDRVPSCQQCDGLMKHATISFGQSLRSEILEQASEMVLQADFCLALGSSLVVEPAASFPRLAKQQGAKLVIINRDATPLDSLADIVIQDSIGSTLAAINEQLCK